MIYNLKITWYREGEQSRTKYEGIIDASSIEDKEQVGKRVEGIIDASSIEDKEQVGKRVEAIIKEGMGKLGVSEFMYKYVEGTVNLIVGAICSGWITTEVQHLCSIASNDGGIFRAIDFYVSRKGQ